MYDVYHPQVISGCDHPSDSTRRSGTTHRLNQKARYKCYDKYKHVLSKHCFQISGSSIPKTNVSKWGQTAEGGSDKAPEADFGQGQATVVEAFVQGQATVVEASVQGQATVVEDFVQGQATVPEAMLKDTAISSNALTSLLWRRAARLFAIKRTSAPSSYPGAAGPKRAISLKN